LNSVAANIRAVREKTGGRQVIGVVKADAYGHGAVEVSRTLLGNGADSLAVATQDEAVALRSAGFSCPILMLGLTPDDCSDALAEYDLTPVTSSYRNALAISEAAKRAGVTKEFFAAVDTGMGRIGVLPGPGGVAEVARMAALPNLKLKGIFAHFASADEKDKSFALKQISVFDDFYDDLKAMGVDPGLRTHANSAAVMELPGALYDAVRPGIMLYGCYPSGEMNKEAFPLAPAMSVKARIMHLKRIRPGSSVSYGRKFTAERESLIATLTLGYADGLPRFLSGKGRVLVRGGYAPLAGNICMDQCMADVTDIANVSVGDEVVFMGAQGGKSITADEIGEKTGTICYETLCGFGQRLPKLFTR
jgi:alanine racemase